MNRTRNRFSWKQAGLAVLFILVCQAAGAIGALTTDTGESSWYAGLEKPAFNPPGWVFGPVWTTLYTLMGIAAFVVWRAGTDRPEVRRALGLFAAQLVLNAVWTPVFFGAESIVGGAVVIVVLLVVLALTVRAFFRVSTVAGWLLVPYLLWIAFATLLNLSIWALN